MELLGFMQEPRATAAEMSPLLGPRRQWKDTFPKLGRESDGAALRGTQPV